MSMRFDVTQVKELAVDLTLAGAGIVPAARAVIEKGALNIKTGARARVTGFPHAPSAPAAISYDMNISATAVEAEIGYDKGKRQGALGNLLEYGSVKNSPIPALAPALREETPNTEKFLAEVAATGLGVGR